MKNFNTNRLKSFFFENWSYIALAIIFLLYFGKCSDNDHLSLAMKAQKQAAEEFIQNSNGFAAKVDSLKKVSLKLKKDIALIKNDSIERIKEIAHLKSKVSTQLAIIKTYSTNDIAKHYQTRYNDKKGVVVTQYGVALSDGIAKQNISELSVCDGVKTEMQVVKTELQAQKQIVKKQDQYIAVSYESFRVLQLAKTEKDKAFDSQQETLKTAEKGIRIEKNKKTFWQVATGVVIIGAGYFFIVE